MLREGAVMVPASHRNLYVMGKMTVLMAVMRSPAQHVSEFNFDLLTTWRVMRSHAVRSCEIIMLRDVLLR